MDFAKLDVDIIGSNAFIDWYWKKSYIESLIRSFKLQKKPVYITEFGSATFQGAKTSGSDAWRFSGPYDEDEQAESNQEYFKLWNQLQPDGCFLYGIQNL